MLQKPPKRRNADSPTLAPIKKRSCNKLVERRRHSLVVKTDLSLLLVPDPLSLELPLTEQLVDLPLLPLRRVPNDLDSNSNLVPFLNLPLPNRLLPLPETLPKYDDLELPLLSVKDDLLLEQEEGGESERLLAQLLKVLLLPLLPSVPPLPLPDLDSEVNGLPLVNLVNFSL